MRSVWVASALLLAAGGCGGSPNESASNEHGHGGSGNRGGAAGRGGTDSGTAGVSTAGTSAGGGPVGGSAGSPTGGSAGTATGGGPGQGGSGASLPDADVPDVRFSYDGPVNPGMDACAATSVEAELVPLAIYIMLDKSGSMGNSGKWGAAKSAITSFVNDPGSAGLKVALNYFPGSGCSGYQNPAVGMGALPGNAAAIVNSLNSTSPGGNTPTAGALNGLVAFCASYQAANPTEKCVGILVSDGSPTACSPSDATGLGNIAANALASNNVLTFTMGMAGANFSVLNAIATQGGTDCDPGPNSACDATGGSGAFLAALQAIQGQALGCEYQMPTTDAGIIDPDDVTVDYSAGGVPPPQTIPRVDNPGLCTPAGGWYYDNNVAPTKITLCPDTCNAVQADANAQVDISLGCLGA